MKVSDTVIDKYISNFFEQGENFIGILFGATFGGECLMIRCFHDVNERKMLL